MIELNDQNFEEEVLKSQKVVLVEFWRPGCKACFGIDPIMEQVDIEIGDRAKIGKLNIYENPKMAQKYKIPAVPTLIIFKNGESVQKAVGLRSKDILVNKINSLI
ncbi:MAG: thioredoxin domain-containing protein [Candidatus Nealsonbacteria bacterium]